MKSWLILICMLVLLEGINLSHKSFLKNSDTSLTIYYDSLCGDSMRFISNYFKPYFNNKDFSSNSKVKLIPGSLMTADGNSLYCKHGYNECLGNVYHACAQNLFGENKFNQFVICYFDYYQNVEDSSLTCAENVGMKSQDLKNCAETDMGRTLALNIVKHKQVYNFQFGHSPLVLVNEDYNRLVEEDVLNSGLFYYLCQNNNTKLPCNSLNNLKKRR